MTPLMDLTLELTRWLQATYPQLEGFFQAFTLAGDFEFYLAVMPLIYWCVDKRFAKHLVYLVLFSYVVNAGLKSILRTPRPFWIDESVGLGESGSFGVPSGHTQTTAIAFLYGAAVLRRWWVWLLSGAIVFLMGLSRIYLGVHALVDVVTGFLIAVVLLLLYLIWLRLGHEAFQNRILGQRLLPMILIPVVLGAVIASVLLLLGAPDESVEWGAYVATANREGLEELVTSLGLLLGVGIGLVLESAWVHLLTGGPLWKRALRYLLGMAGTIAIWLGLGAVFPDDPLWVGIPLRLLRYAILGVWVAYWAPLLFVRLGLADAGDGPEVSLTVNPESLLKG